MYLHACVLWVFFLCMVFWCVCVCVCVCVCICVGDLFCAWNLVCHMCVCICICVLMCVFCVSTCVCDSSLCLAALETCFSVSQDTLQEKGERLVEEAFVMEDRHLEGLPPGSPTGECTGACHGHTLISHKKQQTETLTNTRTLSLVSYLLHCS